jgi:hypothetical protein
MGSRLRHWSLPLSLAAFAVAQTSASTGGVNSPPPPLEGAVFQIRACKGSLPIPQGEVFRILLQDSALIQTAEGLLAAGGTHIVSGSLRAGDGSFNAPWHWHLDPTSITFPDVAAEVCQGCPSLVESNLNYWFHLGAYCPIAEVIMRER